MNPPESLAWSTNLSISGAPRPATVPAYFFRGSLVTLTFDEPPLDVVLVSESSVVSFFGQTLGTTQTMLVRSGLWDVITFFAPESGGDNAVVVHEQQNVQGSFSLNIHRGQAARTIALRAVDDQEQPLDGSKFGKELVIHLPRFTLIIGSWSDFRVSDLSSRYAVGITGTGPDPKPSSSRASSAS